MPQIYYYLTDDLLERVQNESLYYQSGTDKNYDDISIGMDDLFRVKTLLEDISNDVFEKLQKLAKDIDIDILGDAFIFDDTITIDEVKMAGPYVAFTIDLPTNFSTQNSKLLDNAIRRALIACTLEKWMTKKGQEIRTIIIESEKAMKELKRKINYRTVHKKTYQWY